jgi:transposase
MFVQRKKKIVGDKVYHSVALLHNYREDGKIKHKTILNLSSWTPEQIDALDFALKGKSGLSFDEIQVSSGTSFAALFILKHIADNLGITKALTNSKYSALVLLLVFARILTQGSRKHIINWAETQAISSVLGIENFSLDSLYDTLDWLSENQDSIEDKLFKSRANSSNLFLYDVTSSYLEGECNELADYGYNRDKKQGKKQIVIGLLCDDLGVPVSIQAFKGNTSDTKTLKDQIKKVAERFQCKNITFVGDKGMIKSTGIENLKDEEFHYITTITKPQIEKLLEKNIIQLNLFDNDLMEVEEEGIRYIFRKNKDRAREIEKTRESKIQKLLEFIEKENLKSKAKLESKIERVNEKIERLQMHKWTEIIIEENRISIQINEEKKKEAAKLDGCYVIKTDLKEEAKEVIHERYKDLAEVEYAFRTLKTGHLEIRPLYLRKETRTKGHLFVSMLGYMIVKELKEKTKGLGYTVEEILGILEKIDEVKLNVEGLESKTKISQPNKNAEKILEKLGIKLPTNL